tara:strand:- start:6547 stop:6777 length:231 start_codon:yes stop_codon:yes gene_type:complete
MKMQYILAKYDGTFAKFPIEEIRQENKARKRRATMHPVTDKFDGIGLNELLRAIHHNVALKQRNAHGILVNQGLDV